MEKQGVRLRRTLYGGLQNPETVAGGGDRRRVGASILLPLDADRRLHVAEDIGEAETFREETGEELVRGL